MTTTYAYGVWETVLGGNARRTYAFGGSIVAQRESDGSVTYLHGDHLGSMSVQNDAQNNGATGLLYYPKMRYP